MRLSEALTMSSLKGTVVASGHEHLDRTVRWAHVVELPDPSKAAQPDQLLLTTGYSWPQDNPALARLMQVFVDAGVAAVGLATPTFVARFPRAMIKIAEDAKVPLLEIPWEVRFAKVTEEINSSIMAEQYSVIERSAEIHRRMTRAAVGVETLNDLVTVVGELTGCSVLFEDTHGNTLASFDNGTSDELFRTAAAGRGSHTIREHLQQAGAWEKIVRSRGGRRVAASPILGSDARIYCAIRLKGEVVGFVQLMDNTAGSDLNLQAAEHAAVVAALCLANERRIAMLEARLGSSLLDSIIEGHFDGSERSVERAAIWGLSDGERYRVMIGVLGDRGPQSRQDILLRDRLADDCRARFSHPGGMPIASTRLNHIILVLPADVPTDRVAGLLLPRGAGLAVGRAFVGISGIQDSYRDALSVAPFVVGASIQEYEDLVLPRVLAGDGEARESFLSNVLGPFHSVRNGEVLVESLLKLAENGFQYGRTAEQLTLHINTLRNRVHRACTVANLDLDDTDTRFTLELAARLVSFRRVTSGPAARR